MKDEGKQLRSPFHPSSFIVYPFARRGFTLAESLVASVVLALAVVGVSGALVASQQQTDAQEDCAAAVSLARDLMEQAASLALQLSDGTTGLAGWPTTTDPSFYDTANDFDGYRDLVTSQVWRDRNVSVLSVSGAAPPATVIAPGDPLPQLGQRQYLRTVSISYPTSLFGSAVPSGDVAIVNVAVRGASGGQITLSRIVSRTSIMR